MGVVSGHLGVRPDQAWLWATHAGAELDLLVTQARTRRGCALRRTDAPSLTRSMRIALADLRLDRLDVIHAGAHTLPLAPALHAVALARVLTDP